LSRAMQRHVPIRDRAADHIDGQRFRREAKRPDTDRLSAGWHSVQRILASRRGRSPKRGAVHRDTGADDGGSGGVGDSALQRSSLRGDALREGDGEQRRRGERVCSRPRKEMHEIPVGERTWRRGDAYTRPAAIVVSKDGIAAQKAPERHFVHQSDIISAFQLSEGGEPPSDNWVL
jgi:hypothetical protein